MKSSCLFLCVLFFTNIIIEPLYSQWIRSNGLVGERVLSMAVLDSTLFVGTDDNSVFVSIDNGENWTFENEGLKNRSVIALGFSGKILFAGTNNGNVFLSTNNGLSWSYVSTGLQSFTITEIVVAGNNLFAGTYEGGVWRRALSEIVTYVEEEKLSSSFYLYQNYPNPFNSTTTINYIVPKTSFVTIKIYDVLGREIIKLKNEVKHPGKYEARLDGSSLSGGIYFYKMQADNFSDTRKFVLLK